MLATFGFVSCTLCYMDTDVKDKGTLKSIWFPSGKQCLPLPSPFPNMNDSRKPGSSTPLPGESPDLYPSHSMERGMLTQETVADQIWSSPSTDTD